MSRRTLITLFRLSWLGWLLGCALAMGQEIAPPAEPLRLGQAQESYRVEQGVDYLIEEAGDDFEPADVMSREQAGRWRRSTHKQVNLVRHEQPVWLRLRVRNDAAAGDWVLSIDWPLLLDVQLFRQDDEVGSWHQVGRSGTAVPAAQKLSRDPAHIFRMSLLEGEERTVLLRVHSNATLYVPMTFWQPQALRIQRADQAMVMGMLFGVLGVMLLYNVSLYLFTRDPSYRIYTLYLAAVILYELAYTGYGPLYFWGESTWLVLRGYEVFACLSFLSATVFFRNFLELKRAPVVLERINATLIGFWVAALVLTCLFASKWVGAAISVVGTLGGVAGLVTAGFLGWRGNVSARYFLFAWSALVVGTLVSLLSFTGSIESNWITHNGQHLGFVVEVVLLAIALAERIKRERESRELAQREALDLTRVVEAERLEKIAAQAQALEVQREANEALELRVLDRTAELERAMRNLELANEQLAKLSVTDALTKVHNRRYFDDVLHKEHDRSVRSQVPLALVLVDIDHFKRINDTCGHLAGDECLRLVAASLRNTVSRSTDLIARYGGEEFALVLPGTTEEQACELAERVRVAIESLDFICRGRRVPVSVSMGVVAKVAKPGDSIADFIAQADEALYEAKAQGRNRVMLAA